MVYQQPGQQKSLSRKRMKSRKYRMLYISNSPDLYGGSQRSLLKLDPTSGLGKDTTICCFDI